MASRHEALDWLQEKNLDTWTRPTTIRDLVWSLWTYLLWNVESKTIEPNAKERESALLCSKCMNDSEESLECLNLEHIEDLTQLFPTKSPDPLSPENFVDHNIDLLPESKPFSRALTDSASLRPMRIRQFCTILSFNADWNDVVTNTLMNHKTCLWTSPFWADVFRVQHSKSRGASQTTCTIKATSSVSTTT